MFEQNRPTSQLFPPAVKNLIIINALCWLASITLPRFAGIDIVDELGLHYWGGTAFSTIQLVTYMFLHDTSSISHILFNMFGLWMFGKDIENYWGTRRFLIYYFVTGIGAGIVQELVWMATLNPLYANIAVTVGASGALFGLLIAFAMLFPQARIFIMFIPIPIRAPYFVAIYALLELYGGVASSAGDNVAHFAHLGGMIFGLALILYWRRQWKVSAWKTNLKKRFDEFEQKMRNLFDKPDSKQHKQEPTRTGQRNSQEPDIDEILDKIKKSGYQSLTTEEKRFLFMKGNRK